MNKLDHTYLELVPHRLYALGGGLELHGRTSWAAANVRGIERCNCYLLLGAEETMLIDCCPAALRQPVLEQLVSLMPVGKELSVFLTRAEFDTSGNIGAIAAIVPVKAVYVGGSGPGRNPFDGFELAAAPAQGARPLDQIAIHRVASGEPIPLGNGRRLEVIAAPLRMLSAYWAYDTGTGALFPSDSFGYTIGSRDITLEEGFRNLSSRYWWLPGARTDRIAEDVEAVFMARDVEIIAPCHGWIFRGRDEVARQRQKMQEILRYAASAPAAV